MGDGGETTMRERLRSANELSLLAALTVAAAVIILTAWLGRGPAIEPMSVSDSGRVETLVPPHPSLLQGEFRGPTAEEAVNVLDRRHGHEQSDSRWLRCNAPGRVGTGRVPGQTR
jgi:hypothetical protein